MHLCLCVCMQIAAKTCLIVLVFDHLRALMPVPIHRRMTVSRLPGHHLSRSHTHSSSRNSWTNSSSQTEWVCVISRCRGHLSSRFKGEEPRAGAGHSQVRKSGVMTFLRCDFSVDRCFLSRPQPLHATFNHSRKHKHTQIHLLTHTQATAPYVLPRLNHHQTSNSMLCPAINTPCPLLPPHLRPIRQTQHLLCLSYQHLQAIHQR